MKERLKNYLLKAMVFGVYVVGISTVAATSRYTGYQPEEGEELMGVVRISTLVGYGDYSGTDVATSHKSKNSK